MKQQGGDATPQAKPAKKKAAKPKPSDDEKAAAAQHNSTIRNSSIITEGETLSTVAGEIYGWKPCPENLPNHPTMAYFGKRRTGKSTSITNVAYHCCQHIPFGLVMSDTAYADKFFFFLFFFSYFNTSSRYWEKIVPKNLIVQGKQRESDKRPTIAVVSQRIQLLRNRRHRTNANPTQLGVHLPFPSTTTP